MIRAVIELLISDEMLEHVREIEGSIKMLQNIPIKVSPRQIFN